MQTSPSRNTVLYYLFFIFVLPIVLLYFNIIHKNWRIAVLAFCCVLIYGIIKKAQWTRKDLGLGTHSRKKLIIPYTVFILCGVGSIMLLAHIIGFHVTPLWWHSYHFWLIFIFVSYLQEFAYRIFLVPELQKVFKDQGGVILINGLLFALLHIIYPVQWITIPFMLFGGMVFAWMYIKYKDFWLIGFAHSIFNFVAVLYGFFVIH